MARITVRLPSRWPVLILAVLVVLAAASGLVLGYFLKLDLPDVRALEDYTPPLMTRVLGRDSSVVATFAEQRRILIEYPDIPASFLQALIATEDSRFLDHTGIDIPGIFRAAWHDLIRMSKEQGASTLTQQLARGLFLTPEKLWRRKFKEMVLAMEIERTYSKEEILTFYCNQVYVGHGQYGLEAAARYYFDKSARDLTLAESAMLAAILQRPSSLSPYGNPERVLERRNHVLQRMAEEGFIVAARMEAERDKPLGVSPRRGKVNRAPYFVEEIRRSLKSRLEGVSVYQAGLEVRTTLDPRLQEIANRAVESGLRELDRRQGWRGAPGRVPEGEDPDGWASPAWDDGVASGEVTDGVVLGPADGGDVRIRVGPYSGTLTASGARWARKGRPASFLERGDVIRVRVEGAGAEGSAVLLLEQEPAVEGALVAIEPSTGAIRALVGGFSFERSEFNRATQALRQTGSAFKPFVYAAALSEGWTAADILLDEPTVFLDVRTAEPYQPENFGNKYHGLLTLRAAIEHSANIATVKLLLDVGYSPVLDMARNLGITTRLQPYPSLALGAFELSLLELTSAYATFANGGVRVEPYMVTEILDHDGRTVERTTPEVNDVLSPQIAYLMNGLLEGVITDGTGRAAASLGWPLAGKTGTTDDNTDAWFIGYSPDLAVGVWVGFDAVRSLGSRETGALAALPIWKQFMEAAQRGRPPMDFPRPASISEVPVDRETGLRASPSAGCSSVYVESFEAGTEPTRYCTRADHLRLALPYPFHRFAFDERGELVVPSHELDALLPREPTVLLSADGDRLVFATPRGPASLPVRRVYGGDEDQVPARLREQLAEKEIFPEAWVGRDGRSARVILLR